jgi:multicomponent Na+:H+ antiporter subunit E
MTNPFIMHLLVAMVWVFLSGRATFDGFLLAMALTFGLLFLFQKPLHCEHYVRRVNGVALFLIFFLGDVIVSNLRIMRIAVQRNASALRGQFIPYSIEGLRDFEVLLIAHCINLCPGTVVADRTEDGQYLILHVFGTSHPDTVPQELDDTLKKRILNFTR